MDYKKMIRERGLKKKWIASKIGISRTLFSYYLNNKRPMPLHIEGKLNKILEVQ